MNFICFVFQPGKKKFINKNEAVTFHLVHRSQKDPLIVDEDSSKHVLVEAGTQVWEQDTCTISSITHFQNLGGRRLFFSYPFPNKPLFLCPCIDRSAAYSFLSVHLLVCLSAETFKLAMLLNGK